MNMVISCKDLVYSTFTVVFTDINEKTWYFWVTSRPSVSSRDVPDIG